MLLIHRSPHSSSSPPPHNTHQQQQQSIFSLLSEFYSKYFKTFIKLNKLIISLVYILVSLHSRFIGSMFSRQVITALLKWEVPKGVRLSTKARVASRGSIKVELEEGKEYWFCKCGLSQSQPFCDGSHETTDIEPVSFIAKETKTFGLCCCKQTSKAPFCDGSHNLLPEGEEFLELGEGARLRAERKRKK